MGRQHLSAPFLSAIDFGGSSIPARVTQFRMRALMNFMHRDGWWFHIRAADAKTVPLTYREAANEEALLRIVAKLGASVEDAELDIRRWNRGCDANS